MIGLIRYDKESKCICIPTILVVIFIALFMTTILLLEGNRINSQQDNDIVYCGDITKYGCVLESYDELHYDREYDLYYVINNPNNIDSYLSLSYNYNFTDEERELFQDLMIKYASIYNCAVIPISVNE